MAPIIMRRYVYCVINNVIIVLKMTLCGVVVVVYMYMPHILLC